MSEVAAERALTHIGIVTELVAAYVRHNRVPAAQLPELIASLHLELDQIAQGSRAEEAAQEPGLASAAQIRESVTSDALISFIDGMPYQMLKRHLTAHGLTPATYRARYGLPDDYPMTAPSYSGRRSAIAKGMGFGNRAGRSRKVRN